MAKLNLDMPTLRLNDGKEIPMLGYGTGTAMYKRQGFDKIDTGAVEAISTAIRVGYRHLDGAEAYNTEPELGKAIKESKISRDELFVTTKITPGGKTVASALDASLKKLGLEYVDLYLVHQPYFTDKDEDLQQTWREMEEVKASGKTRSIGVSNFRQKELEAIMKTAKELPAINQIELHAYLQRENLHTFCKTHGIALAAYAPLTPVTRAHPGPVDDLLAQLAKKYAVNPGEILLRWCIEKEIVVVTTSSKEQRLSDMLRVAAFRMTPREVEELSKVASEKKYRAFWGNKYPENDYE